MKCQMSADFERLPSTDEEDELPRPDHHYEAVSDNLGILPLSITGDVLMLGSKLCGKQDLDRRKTEHLRLQVRTCMPIGYDPAPRCTAHTNREGEIRTELAI